MFTAKWLRVAAGALVGGGSLAMATLYTWGGDPSGNWSDQKKWNDLGCTPPCYPSTTDDDAVIDTANVTITLTENVGIDDLYISEREYAEQTVFTIDDPDKGGWTVTCDTITISDSRVRVTNEAGFETRKTEPCPKK